jgi:hypothetical protein
MSDKLPNALDEEYMEGYQKYYYQVMRELGIKPTPYTEEEITVLERAQMDDATSEDEESAENVIMKHENEGEDHIIHMQAFFAQGLNDTIKLNIH